MKKVDTIFTMILEFGLNMETLGKYKEREPRDKNLKKDIKEMEEKNQEKLHKIESLLRSLDDGSLACENWTPLQPKE